MAVSGLVYPASRTGRGVPSSSAGALQQETTGNPTTRTLAFRIANAVVNTRASRSFGPFVGPAVLKRVRTEINANVAGAQAQLGIGVSPTSITETSVVFTTAKGWRPLIETVIADGSAVQALSEGFWQTESPATALVQGGQLDIIIPDARFFLVFTAYASATAGFRWVGDATLIENVSPQALATFL